MKINPVNEYTVEVELPAAEMERLGLRFESMDWADVETRRAVWSLVGLLRERGVEIRLSGRLLIEAGKLPDGMRLCFTSLPRGETPRLKIKKETRSPVLRCACAGDAAAARICLPDAVCTLYAAGERRFLLVRGTYTGAALARAAEYGDLMLLPHAGETLEEYAVRVTP